MIVFCMDSLTVLGMDVLIDPDRGALGSGRSEPNQGPTFFGPGFSLRFWYMGQAWIQWHRARSRVCPK